MKFSRRGLLHSSLATAATPGAATASGPHGPAARIADVRAFGARGDGVNDDTAAINAAIQSLRDGQVRIGGFDVAPRLVFPAGIYLVAGTIDLTRLWDINLVIDGNGSVLLGRCAGLPVIDALGSRWLTLRDLTIIGAKDGPPCVGVQVGLATKDRVADDHRFENVKILGHFSLACLLNVAAETTAFDHVLLWNDAPRPDSYCLIQDGLNHFAASSAFAVEARMATDKDDSFNENLFINCDFRHGGGGVPVWLGDTARHSFIRCYAAGTGAAAFVLYCGPNSHSMLDIDCHCEAAGLRSVFLVSGASATPVIRGFSYRDHEPFAAQSVFHCDAHIVRVAVQNARIEAGWFFDRSARVFDDPRRWTVSGSYYSPDAVSWNGAGCFTGVVMLGGGFTFAGDVGGKVAAGATRQRPTGLGDDEAGQMYLDTTLGQLIVWSGSAWRDAMGHPA
jgi:hypothetical protein